MNRKRIMGALPLILLAMILGCNRTEDEQPVKADIANMQRAASSDSQRSGENERSYVLTHNTYVGDWRRRGGRYELLNMYTDENADLNALARAKAYSGDAKLLVRFCGKSNELIRAFVPYSNELYVHALHDRSDEGPLPGDLIWPGYDNPYVNRARKFRTVCRGVRLVSSLWLEKDPHSPFTARDPTSAEVRWMFLTLVGAGFQGITCRNITDEFFYYQSKLDPYCGDLSSADFVNGAKSASNQPVSVLVSTKRLFVVMVNPSFVSEFGEDGDPLLPAPEAANRKAELFIALPDGVAVKNGKYLFQSNPLEVSPVADGVEVSVNYEGGGEILVFDLKLAEGSHKE